MCKEKIRKEELLSFLSAEDLKYYIDTVFSQHILTTYYARQDIEYKRELVGSWLSLQNFCLSMKADVDKKEE